MPATTHPNPNHSDRVDRAGRAGRADRLDELTERARRVLDKAPSPPRPPLRETGEGEHRTPAPNPSPRDGRGRAARGDGAGLPTSPAPLPSPLVGEAPGGRAPGLREWEAKGDEAEIVIGVDPGTATTGFGVVRRPAPDADVFEAVTYGVVETPAGQPMPERLATLHRELRAIVEAHRPTQAAVEMLYFGKNSTTAMTVGQARGVVLLTLAEAGIPVAEYKPMEVKKATAGFGGAEKPQMQRMVQMLLSLPEIPRPDDAADGLALALTHLRLARLRALGIR